MMPDTDRSEYLEELERDYGDEWIPWDLDNQEFTDDQE